MHRVLAHVARLIKGAKIVNYDYTETCIDCKFTIVED